ncbi:hypothetical protein [Plantactinospora sp. WMMB782]|uniref:hypothetical protein n=1 Tax=Plantactinospora sp. WMMB782 TaxID=3404121 RepID=UPI003B94447F
MSPEEHYAEAERLRALAVEHWMNPEGGYDDAESPTAEEREIRASVAADARQDAMVYLAEAQVHATLALYRKPAAEPFVPKLDW